MSLSKLSSWTWTTWWCAYTNCLQLKSETYFWSNLHTYATNAVVEDWLVGSMWSEWMTMEKREHYNCCELGWFGLALSLIAAKPVHMILYYVVVVKVELMVIALFLLWFYASCSEWDSKIVPMSCRNIIISIPIDCYHQAWHVDKRRWINIAVRW